MTASKAQQKAGQKYVSNNYERVVVTFKKGEKEPVQAAAEAAGVSMNKYIVDAVKARVAADTAGQTPTTTEE